jgi:hypothetical protein
MLLDAPDPPGGVGDGQAVFTVTQQWLLLPSWYSANEGCQQPLKSTAQPWAVFHWLVLDFPGLKDRLPFWYHLRPGTLLSSGLHPAQCLPLSRGNVRVLSTGVNKWMETGTLSAFPVFLDEKLRKEKCPHSKQFAFLTTSSTRWKIWRWHCSPLTINSLTCVWHLKASKAPWSLFHLSFTTAGDTGRIK